ncbi:uncharacterized protein LOC142934366 isoform X2 [Anarhichas minor]|uniref:uncharacterized protein LOC142934366 isoform X2 n=1 Tax=Anarhichas minor TaxID=65739 RepID=UPI003F731FFD
MLVFRFSLLSMETPSQLASNLMVPTRLACYQLATSPLVSSLLLNLSQPLTAQPRLQLQVSFQRSGRLLNGPQRPPVSFPAGLQRPPLFLFPLGRSNLLFQQSSTPQRPLGESSRPQRPIGESSRPQRPLGESSRPQRPIGESSRPQRPLGESSRPQRPLGESSRPQRPIGQSSALQVVLQLDPSGAALFAWSSSCQCSETVLLGCSPPHSPAL